MLGRGARHAVGCAGAKYGRCEADFEGFHPKDGPDFIVELCQSHWAYRRWVGDGGKTGCSKKEGHTQILHTNVG